MTARRLAVAVAALALAGSARAQVFSEGFDDVAALPAAGWVLVNNSAPPANAWFQGNPGVYAAQSGAAGSYVAANFLSTGFVGSIDQWLITPELTLHGGEPITFYTRTAEPGFNDLVRVRFSPGSGTALANFSYNLLVVGTGGTYPSAGWTAFSTTVPPVPGLSSGRIAFQYNQSSSPSADYVGIDSLVVSPLPDGDGDGVPDASDRCPTLPDPAQGDGDGDGVGDLCDNCTTRANPRLGPPILNANPWMTLTGSQRDDDHDGYGNRCDAKFPGVGGLFVGQGDLDEWRASNVENRTGDTCGTIGTRPCAIFDLDETGLFIGNDDLNQFRLLNTKAPGPKCAACPLPCTSGTAGSCN